MIGNPFKIADGLEQHGGLGAVLLAELLRAELHQIGAQNVLIVVALIFAGFDGHLQRGCAAGQGSHTVPEALCRTSRHFFGQILTTLQGNKGGAQQALIQLGSCLGRRAVRHQPAGQLLQQAGHGQQQCRAQNVKYGMRHSNAKLRRAQIQQRDFKNSLHHAEHREPHGGANDIEGQMYQRRPFGVLGGAHGGNQRSDAGADVLSHDDGNGRAIGDLSGAGQCLQNTDRGGAGLNDGSQNGTRQHSQHRILEHDKHLPEFRNVFQPGYRAGHGLHSEHQRGKTKQNRSGVLLFAVFRKQVADHAYQRKNRRERRGLEQADKYISAFNAAQTQNPRRDCGAHIGAHDHIDGLAQGQQAGIDEANYHDGRG